MKKEYNIIGLDCANCALTLEKYLQKVKGVNNANINFSTSKLYLDSVGDKVEVFYFSSFDSSSFESDTLTLSF